MALLGLMRCSCFAATGLQPSRYRVTDEFHTNKMPDEQPSCGKKALADWMSRKPADRLSI